MQQKHHILIIGGGSAGITVAASLTRHSRGKSFAITIIDPAHNHYYQPAFTLVGGGCYDLKNTHRPMKQLIPRNVTWIQDSVTQIQASDRTVFLKTHEALTYDYLVICPGLINDWKAISGLQESLGHQGVCSNYSPQHAEYTWKSLQLLKKGNTALFTQAPLPFKCPGAPQKAAYLAADYLKSRGRLKSCSVHFLTPTPSLFGIPYFAKQLTPIANGYGIQQHFHHSLIDIHAEKRLATFKITLPDTTERFESYHFDMLHVTPHQKTPSCLQKSSLCDAAGFITVHKNTLQHTQFTNILALGDACNAPNSKTAAAVRKQAPTVVNNIHHLIDKTPIEPSYLGYASCPLITGRGKVIMAEFIYGGKVTPTLPRLVPANRPSWLGWQTKAIGLPLLYWHFMLKGYEKFIEPEIDWVQE
jgi:sulfide:quinone oxidoreductase